MPKKIYTGTVIKNAMDKTVTVSVTRLYQHPLYKKIVKKTNKIKAHDEQNLCMIGDKIKISESKPYSKTKRWTVVERLETAEVETAEKESQK
ncbi:Ribosomal protein S17, bacterial-type [Candidatus Magnetoovum chiemensis]|nr:Ribosomal protein S17, bacterial-type [Candidatus Magnetoovum chiemensis]